MIDQLWYKNAVVYSLDVDSFMDANGDGVGDFEGLIRRLDYLEALGIRAIWVAPFQPSPNRDNGYDVADYYGVDPRHGSSGDFVEFVHQARKRGIRVMMDLVVNHTSRDHRWFQEARRDPASKYRDWYVWSKERPEDWNTGMIFPGVQESTWTYDEAARMWYFHRFFEHQPDLNMDNPAVREEVRRIIGFWLELGVAGFRLDAVPFLIESTRPGVPRGEMHFDYLEEFRDFLQWRAGDAVLLGEANVEPKDTRPYFRGTGGGGIHMMFNFYVNQHLFLALATGDARPLAGALKATRRIPDTAQWAHFLRNHDELDLGRLTEEQRQAVFARFAPDEDMQLYGRGIRRRLAPMLGDRRQEELAYSVLFSLPGTPVLRYGDEIGMGDDLSLPERAAVRTPMQWADAPHGGFSSAETTFAPVIRDGVWGYPHVSVEQQRRKPDSLLNTIARLIRLRTECPEIGCGAWDVLPTGSSSVLGLRFRWRDRSVVTLHNFADHPQEARLKLDDDAPLLGLLDEQSSEAVDGTHRIALEAHGYRWYRPGGLGYAVAP